MLKLRKIRLCVSGITEKTEDITNIISLISN